MATKNKQFTSLIVTTNQKSKDLLKRVPTMGRTALFKKLMIGGLSDVVKINLASIIALFPVIYFLVQIFTQFSTIQSNLPYSSFFGAGYPAVVESAEIAFVATQEVIKSYFLMLPLAITLSLFLLISTGYQVRNFIYTEGFFKFKTFFKAFKFNWLNGLVLAVIGGALSFGGIYMVYTLRSILFYGGLSFVNVLYCALFGVLAFIVLCVLFYAYSLTLTYKGTFAGVLRDSFYLTFRFPLPNFVIMLATLAPFAIIALAPAGIFFSLIIMAFALVGITYMQLVFSVYSQFMFDRVTGKA